MSAIDPERLRQIVVRATVPLMGEYDTLTTARIAEAAGVTEADLVAAFPDKEAVLQACILAMQALTIAAFTPTDEVRRIAAIRVNQPLAARLTEVLAVLDAYQRRVRADLSAAFENADFPATAETSGTTPISRQELRTLHELPEIRDSVTALLEPEGQRLRVPAGTLAEAFLILSRLHHPPSEEMPTPLPPEQLVDLFLNGALITG